MRKDKSTRSPARTPIWAEGRQHAPFDLRAFARATLLFGRGSMAALVSRCAHSAGDFGAVVATGRWRVPEHRLGRSGRYLPGYRRVAGAIAGAGGILAHSARVVGPDGDPAMASIFAPATAPEQAVAPVAMPAPLPVARPALRLVQPGPEMPVQDPQGESQPADASLAAIRMIMHAPPPVPRHSAPARHADALARAAQPDPAEWADDAGPAMAPVAEAPPPRSPLIAQMGGLAARATGHLLGYGLIAMSLPWGAARAMAAHLNGVDLRKLDG